MSRKKYLMIRQIEERLEESEQAVNLTKLFVKEVRARRQNGRGEGSFTREQLYHLQVGLYGGIKKETKLRKSHQ
jgi:hypothetical protein